MRLDFRRATSTGIGQRHEFWLLVGITLLAAGLRLYRLGTWSFWIDEMFTVQRAQSSLNLATILSEWPPLSILLTGGALSLLGVNEWSARLVPALVGIASVPALYLPTRKVFGPAVAVLSALLLALSPWHIYWSQNARFYTSLMLLSSLALFAFFFGVEQHRPRHLLFSIVLLFLSMLERLHALFLVPGAVSYLLLVNRSPLERPPGLRARHMLLLALAASVLLVAYFPAFGEVITTFGGAQNHDPLRLLSSIAYRLDVAVISLGVAGGVHGVLRKNRAAVFMLLGAVVPVVLLLAASPFMFTVDRYIFAALPFWLVLAALAIKEMAAQCSGGAGWLGVGVLVLVFGTLVSEDMLYYAFQRGNRPDWRSAVEVVARRRLDSDAVAATSPPVARYYLGTDVEWINSVELESMANRRTWFLIDESTGGVEPDLHQWIRQNGELVEVIAVRMPGKNLDIRVYVYGR